MSFEDNLRAVVTQCKDRLDEEKRVRVLDERVSELVEKVYEIAEKVAALERGLSDLGQTSTLDKEANVQEKFEDGLKPCPFCGESETLIVRPGEKSDFYIYCHNCWAQGPPRSDEEQVMMRWSQRVT